MLVDTDMECFTGLSKLQVLSVYQMNETITDEKLVMLLHNLPSLRFFEVVCLSSVNRHVQIIMLRDIKIVFPRLVVSVVQNTDVPLDLKNPVMRFAKLPFKF